MFEHVGAQLGLAVVLVVALVHGAVVDNGVVVSLALGLVLLDVYIHTALGNKLLIAVWKINRML